VIRGFTTPPREEIHRRPGIANAQVTVVTASITRACYRAGMKTTYDPRPAPLGWFARFAEATVALLLDFLLAVFPRLRR